MKNNRVILILLMVASLAILLRTTWLNDDAFITLRTVDNWVHGYGLTFNPPERVQAYTHPLWMLLMAGMHVIVRDGYFTLVLLGLSITIISLVLFLKTNDDILAVSFGWAALMLSKSFVDFSTSGLENPATHLLLLLFITLFLKTEFPAQPSRVFTLALLAGLSALNRMDSLLLFLPALFYLLYRQRLARDASTLRQAQGIASLSASLGLVMAGFGPFLLWELFSLFYYGFLFPNTYYAKLHAGVPQSLLFNQGILYYLNSILWDPITLLVTFTALALAFQQQEWKEKQIAFGITLYLFYILYIGGDFMSGRFFSAVFFASVILLVRFFAQVPVQQKYILAGIVIFFGILSPRGTLVTFLGTHDEVVLDEHTGISDEREVYFAGTSLMSMNRAFDMPQHMFAQWGRQYLQEGRHVTVEGAAGMVGYYGGPNLHVIDVFALADPLLARLPIDNPFARIGHFERDLPKGYIETVESGENKIANFHLAEFYEKMKLITTGDLFLPGRLKTIWEMNTGQYDYLIQKATEYIR